MAEYKVKFEDTTTITLSDAEVREGQQIHLIRYGVPIPALLGAIIYAEENLGKIGEAISCEIINEISE